MKDETLKVVYREEDPKAYCSRCLSHEKYKYLDTGYGMYNSVDNVMLCWDCLMYGISLMTAPRQVIDAGVITPTGVNDNKPE